MAPSRFLDLAQPGDPEWSDWDRGIVRAFHAWEADRCPGCGQPLSEALYDEQQSEAERTRYRASFARCTSCESMQHAQHVQHKADEAERKRRGPDGPPVLDRGRRWLTTPLRPGGNDG